ncbi:hypothetical protein SAMN02745126_00420 [Enhydrobacter aerosaccus]|uniref:Uncharacterized protein n=1 Tax=Enhydrobacter aerosaccus TaxID=225324 RepID=A0A1T4JSH9_9HYPH|nr:hypothetical protein [Enhydrobacter aerosaccus]SJZ33160.1 hypothetical protein SAMN02745126_00420 [Enhydrobacter aerosaccus]
MIPVIGTIAFGLAAAAFIRWGEPILGSLLVICAIVWVASALPLGPHGGLPRRRVRLLRLE